MKVDVGRLKDVLEEFKDSESSNYNFAVGAQVKRSNVLPLLTMEGMGTIPIPVSIKVKHFIWIIIYYNANFYALGYEPFEKSFRGVIY